MDKYLIVVDMQNDFITGVLGTAEAVAIVPKIKQKINECRKNGYEIIFTRDTHDADYLATLEGINLPVPHCIKGTDGWQLTGELDIKDAMIFDKLSFGTLQLGSYLKEKAKAPAEIELIGLCTDICVISNALILKAYFPKTIISVSAALCAGVTPQSHINALKAMQMCQVCIKE